MSHHGSLNDQASSLSSGYFWSSSFPGQLAPDTNYYRWPGSTIAILIPSTNPGKSNKFTSHLVILEWFPVLSLPLWWVIAISLFYPQPVSSWVLPRRDGARWGLLKFTDHGPEMVEFGGPSCTHLTFQYLQESCESSLNLSSGYSMIFQWGLHKTSPKQEFAAQLLKQPGHLWPLHAFSLVPQARESTPALLGLFFAPSSSPHFLIQWTAWKSGM